jgi:membrane protein YdbS with pleckstrin-like domain
MTGSHSETKFVRAVLAATRLWLPVAIAIAGVVAIVIGHGRANSTWAAAGVSLMIVALTVWLINWLFRMSVESNRDREREEQARQYFDEHGRWPGE